MGMRGSAIYLVVALLAGMALLAAGPSTAPVAVATTAPSISGKSTVVIPLGGKIDDYTRDTMIKRFAAARAIGAQVVILQIDTYGGLVTSALDMSRYIKNQADLHVIAYVNDKAISAGAMIAMACDEIVMANNAVIGDCAPIAVSDNGKLEALPPAERAKMESPILADFDDSAMRNGHDPLLAEAMVAVGRVVYYIKNGDGQTRFVGEDDYKKLKDEGWSAVEGVPSPVDAADRLLTVHTPLAMKLGIAKSTAANVDTLIGERSLQVVRRFEPSVGDQIVEFLAGNWVRFILLTIFLQSLYIAISTPGHGGPEAIAVISLGLLVGTPLLTGYATWWELVIIFGGLALLAFEIFVFPGHFVSGIVGALMVIGGLILTFVGKEPGGTHVWPNLEGTWQAMGNGVIVVTAGLGCSLLLWMWLSRYLPRLPYFNRIILTTTSGNLSLLTSGPVETGPAVGDVGVAVTDLKPGGSARFITDSYPDGRLASVVSDAGYVHSGTKVVVREVGGNRIVVRANV
jgi:membrane-bound serine protease (ClpP class)